MRAAQVDAAADERKQRPERGRHYRKRVAPRVTPERTQDLPGRD